MDKEQSSFFKRFGSIVRKLRFDKDMTLEDMGEFGFSPQHFQKIEAGKKAVNLYTAYRIARTFRVKLRELTKDLE